MLNKKVVLATIVVLAIVVIVLVVRYRKKKSESKKEGCTGDNVYYAKGALKPVCTGSDDCTECVEVCRRMGMDGPPYGPGSNTCVRHHCRDFCGANEALDKHWCGTAAAAHKQPDACRRCVALCVTARQGTRGSCAKWHCSALC